MKIGNVELTGQVCLAPMAGVTDGIYRAICRRFGAALCTTEMVSSRAIEYNYNKTFELMRLADDDHPAAVQLFGNEPLILARAAAKARDFSGAEIIDINMGCPVPKVAGNGCGSALMLNPSLCGAIVRSVKSAVDVPVTVKIRKGWDDQHVNAVEVAKICEEAGADAICVHGRTRAQMYQPSADWDIIRAVKQAVQVPVIGNGDVTDAQSAALMLQQTGCDMVMVGRGALGDPWIFQQINAYLTDGCRILPPPTAAQRIVVIRKHIGALCEVKGEEHGMREARKHVGWYMKGLRGAADFRRRAGSLSTLSELDALLADVYRENSGEPPQDTSRVG